jgi:hypothetical protein
VEPASGGKLLREVPVDIIDNFLRDFQNSPDSPLSAIEPIRRYIGDRRSDELAKWDVLITSLKPTTDKQRKTSTDGAWSQSIALAPTTFQGHPFRQRGQRARRITWHGNGGPDPRTDRSGQSGFSGRKAGVCGQGAQLSGQDLPG